MDIFLSLHLSNRSLVSKAEHVVLAGCRINASIFQCKMIWKSFLSEYPFRDVREVSEEHNYSTWSFSKTADVLFIFEANISIVKESPLVWKVLQVHP